MSGFISRALAAEKLKARRFVHVLGSVLAMTLCSTSSMIV
jgi:hypothetical protein